MSDTVNVDKKIGIVGEPVGGDINSNDTEDSKDTTVYNYRQLGNVAAMKKKKSKPLKLKKVMTPEQRRVRAMVLKHQKNERDVVKAITKKYGKEVVGLINAPDHSIRITRNEEFVDKQYTLDNFNVNEVLNNITLYAGSVILGKLEVTLKLTPEDLVNKKLYLGRILNFMVIFKLTNYTNSVSFANHYPDPIMVNIIRSLYVAQLVDAIKKTNDDVPDDMVHMYIHQNGFFPEPVNVVISPTNITFVNRQNRPIYDINLSAGTALGYRLIKENTDSAFGGNCQPFVALAQLSKLVDYMDTPPIEEA